MDRSQFHADRLTGIGGSDAAAALGLSPYRSQLELYMEKRGELPPFEGNEATLWGTLLEPVVRNEYARRTGREVTVPPLMRHPKHGFVIAHADGLTTDGRAYEGKTARTADGWGEPGTDQVPQAYLIQCQHVMLVTATPVTDLAVLIGGQDFRTYEIPADRELQQMILDGEADFWSRVQEGRAPDPNFNGDSDRELIKRLYPGTNGEILQATEQHMAWRTALEEAQELSGHYANLAAGAKSHLLWQMKEAAALVFPDGKALRRKVVTKKPYTVEAQTYIDGRFVNHKESKE